MIDDPELRELFAAESEEHLQNLERGLLHLEKHPGDLATLKESFREAHSLKGAARMLGVSDVEALAHHFEDVLGAASKGQRAFLPDDVDRLTRGLDDLRALAEESVTGKVASVSLTEALQRLATSTPSPTAPPEKKREKVVMPARALSEAAPQPPKPSVSSAAPPPSVKRAKPVTPAGIDPEPVASAPSEDSGLFSGGEDTASVIRVHSHKLDALLKLVGELAVVRTRVKQRLSEIEETITAWEAYDHHGIHSGHSHASNGSVANDHLSSHDNSDPFGNRLHLLRHGLFEDEAGLELVAEALEEGIRNLRLLPLSSLFNQFPRMVRDLARQQGKEVRFLTEGGETTADKRILEEMKSPLMHLIRNAVDHGLEDSKTRQAEGKPREGLLTLRVSQTATHVVLEVRDDGRGMDLEAIRNQAHKRGLFTKEVLAGFSKEQLYGLIFHSGFSTSRMVTDVSGRGVGLDAVRTNVERLKGRIQVRSELGHGSCFTIYLPITLATTPVFIVSASDQRFAIPLDFVHSVRRVSPKDIFSIEGCETIALNEAPVSVARLAHLLELPTSPEALPQPPWPCVILNLEMDGQGGNNGWLGVIVDTLEEELEVVLKPHGGILKRVRNLAGATILGSGDVCMVVNPQDLLLTVRKHGRRLAGSSVGDNLLTETASEQKSASSQEPQKTKKKRVLLAEDSITTRTQEKRILQSAGYEVVAAVDGQDAFNKLGKQPFDAVVSDVQMPNLDGLALAKRIRENPRFKDLPIILVTSLSSDEDLRRGMEVGASAYITKPTFEQKAFLETLRRLV